MKIKFVLAGLLAFAISTITVYGEIRPSANQFPVKTIIVGTHAIVLDAMTEDVLQAALTSADKENQNAVYFKSDINAGTWYDISNSKNIEEISVTTENIVTNDVIDNLPLTHYTKADGTTVDFKTGEQVSPSVFTDISNPANMPEMEEIITEKDIQNALGDTTAKKRVQSINNVLAVIDDEGKILENYNKGIASMEAWIDAIQKDASVTPDMIHAAIEAKGKLENERKAFCIQFQIDRLNEESKKLDYDTCKDLIDKYSTAITALQKSLSDVVETTDENPSALDKVLKQYTDSMIKAVTEEPANSKGALSALQGIAATNSAMAGDINVSPEMKEKQKEMLAVIYQESESGVKKAIADAAKNEAYKNAVQTGASSATIQKISEDIASDIGTKLAEAIAVTENINLRETDSQKQLSNLQSVNNLCEEAAKGVPADMQAAVNEMIAEKKKTIQDAVVEVKLAAVPAYSQLAKEADAISKTIQKTYEKYMGAVEKKENADMAKLKVEIDKMTTQEQAYREIMGEMKENAQKNEPIDTAKAIQALASNQSFAENEQAGETQGTTGNEQTAGSQGTTGNEQTAGSQGTTGNEQTAGSQGTTGNEQTAGTQGTTGNEQTAGTHGTTGNEQTAVTQGTTGNEQTTGTQGTTGNEQTVGTQGTTGNEQTVGTQGSTGNEQTAGNQGTAGSGQSDTAVANNVYFKEQKQSVPIAMQGKEIYVPAKSTGQILAAQTIINKNQKTIVVKGNGALIEFVLGEKIIYVNDRAVPVAVAPYAQYGDYFIPLSCFEKAFGLTHIQQDTQIIAIRK